MNVVVGYHGHCFDGMASAALFTRFIREREGADVAVTYRGLDHQPGGSHVPEKILAGDVNAVVDFRFTLSPKLTWWFDHHRTGIVGDEERAALEADGSGRKFFDPDCGSCCQLIADVLAERFGFRAPELDDLVAWAHRIDSAAFADPDAAMDLSAPALRLMTVIEVYGDDAFLAPRIDRLARGERLEEVAADHEVKKRFGPLHRAHRRTVRVIEERARLERGVVSFDLTDRGNGGDRYNKFIPYRLFPDARYCVAVTAGPRRAKVSVGSNPWAPVPRTHDISEICARYGGGGHPVVGAVTLPAADAERARAIATEIAATLRGQ
jgi:hypothetical protein